MTEMNRSFEKVCEKHALVLHESPDLEALFMAYVVMKYTSVQRALNVRKDPYVKFIPAGPLHEEDWLLEKDELTAECLEERGYLFLDCGGGELDQHGKPHLFGERASIDLLVEYAREAFPVHLLPIAKVISENDLTGQQIIKDGGMKRSETPNTPRHLRNVIIGWNTLHAGRPEVVLDLAIDAFFVIDDMAREKYERAMGKPSATRERVLTNMRIRSLFLVETIANRLREEVTMNPEVEHMCDALYGSLRVLQEDWERAEEDFRRAEVQTVTTERQEGGVTLTGGVSLVVGSSDTVRFGQVARYRSMADVVVQFRRDGRFMISSSGGRDLSLVAAEVRKADLKKRCVECDDMDLLSRRGHVEVPDGRGATVQAIYLAEFGTAFGNAFRANAHGPRSRLTRKEIREAVLRGLHVVTTHVA